MDEDSDSSWDQVHNEDTSATTNEPAQSLRKRKGWFSFLQQEDSYPKYPLTVLEDFPPLTEKQPDTHITLDTQNVNNVPAHNQEDCGNKEYISPDQLCSREQETPERAENEDEGPPPLEDTSPLPEMLLSTENCTTQPDVYVEAQNECVIEIPDDSDLSEPTTMERLASTFVTDLWFWTTDIILSVSVISIVSCFTNLVWQTDAS